MSRAVGLAAVLAAVAVSPVLAAGGAPGFAGCRSFVSPAAKAVQRPGSIVFACGDGNFYATMLRWSRWDAKEALATGLGHQNDCNPYCAAGRFHVYRLTVRLFAPALCGSQRRFEFTRVSWAFSGAKPAGASRSGSESFRCRA